MISEKALTKTVRQLESEYKEVLQKQANGRATDFFPAVLEKRADYDYSQKKSGRTFEKVAMTAISITTGWKGRAAMAAATALKSRLVKAQSMRNQARYYENFRDVDTKRMNRSADLLDRSLVDYVRGAGEAIKPSKGVVHAYDIIYHETQEYGKPSELKHEPEELQNVFKSMEGFSAMSRLTEVLGTKSPKEMADGELIAYATEKARDKGSQNALNMTIGEIEQYALEDASKARMSVKLREIQAKGSKSQSAKDLAAGRSADQNKLEQRLDGQADNRKKLIAATMALAGVKNNTSLKNISLNDNQSLAAFASEVDVSRETIGDLRQVVEDEGRKAGMSKILSMVEKQALAKKKALEKALEPKLKQKKAGQEQEGGRQIGEGRPGAKAFRGY